MEQSPTWFDVYLVNVKSSGRLFQIFVPFSDCLNFTLAKLKKFPLTATDFSNGPTVEFVFSNVAYGPTVYKTGH